MESTSMKDEDRHITSRVCELRPSLLAMAIQNCHQTLCAIFTGNVGVLKTTAALGHLCAAESRKNQGMRMRSQQPRSLVCPNCAVMAGGLVFAILSLILKCANLSSESLPRIFQSQGDTSPAFPN